MLASFSRLRLAGFGSEGLRRAACRWQCAVGGGLCDVSDASRVFRRRPKICKKSFLTLINKGNNFAGGGNESRTTHREKRVVPFTPEHVYSVVGDVKKYEEFVLAEVVVPRAGNRSDHKEICRKSITQCPTVFIGFRPDLILLHCSFGSSSEEPAKKI